jgi:hypothetical protein
VSQIDDDVIVLGVITVANIVVISTLFFVKNRKRQVRDDGVRMPIAWTFNELQVDLPRQVIVELVPDAMRAIGAKDITRSEDFSSFLGWTGVTFRSWGQALRVSLKSESSDHTAVYMESYPKMGIALGDNGAGKKLLGEFTAELERRIQQV